MWHTLLYEQRIVFADSRKVINVAGIFTPFNASGGTDVENIQSISAFIMGIQEINSRNDILPNHIVKFTVRSPIGFIDTVETIIDIQKHAFNGTNVEAFVTGLPYSTTSALNNVINEHLQKLYITTTTGAVQLSHSDVGSYKIRTVPADSFNGMALQDVIDNAFKYNKVSLFYSYDEASLRTSMEIGDGVFGKMEQLSSHAFQTRTADFTDHINAAKDAGSQIFIISCDGQDGAVLMEQGYNQGLFREGTQIFGSALLTQSHPWKYMSNHANIPDIMKGYIGIMFDPSFHLQDSQEGKDFVSKFRSQKATVTVNSDGTETCDESKDDDGHYLYREQTQTHSGPGQRVRCAGMDFSSLKADGSDIAPHAPHAYDAVYLLAYGLHNLLEIQGKSLSDVDKLRQVIIDNVTFTGTTGLVDIYEGMSEFDDYGAGDRESGHVYRLFNFNEEKYRISSTTGVEDDVYNELGYWTPETHFHFCDVTVDTYCSPITYRTKDNQPAKDSPDDIIILMPEAMSVALYVIGAMIALLVISTTVGVIIYRQNQIIKVSQPAMLYVILAGAMLGAGRVVAGGIPLSDTTCITDVWFMHLSFVLVCGSLFVKSWRVNALMNSTKIRRIKITIRNVLLKVALATVVMILYLIFLTVYGHNKVQMVATELNNQVTIRPRCNYRHPEVELALYAIEGVVLVMGARLCWALKTLPSSFNESKYIASAITCLVTLVAIAAPMSYILDLEEYIDSFLITIAYGIWISFTVVILFGYKLYYSSIRDMDSVEGGSGNGGGDAAGAGHVESYDVGPSESSYKNSVVANVRQYLRMSSSWQMNIPMLEKSVFPSVKATPALAPAPAPGSDKAGGTMDLPVLTRAFSAIALEPVYCNNNNSNNNNNKDSSKNNSSNNDSVAFAEVPPPQYMSDKTVTIRSYYRETIKSSIIIAIAIVLTSLNKYPKSRSMTTENGTNEIQILFQKGWVSMHSAYVSVCAWFCEELVSEIHPMLRFNNINSPIEAKLSRPYKYIQVTSYSSPKSIGNNDCIARTPNSLAYTALSATLTSIRINTVAQRIDSTPQRVLSHQENLPSVTSSNPHGNLRNKPLNCQLSGNTHRKTPMTQQPEPSVQRSSPPPGKPQTKKVEFQQSSQPHLSHILMLPQFYLTFSPPSDILTDITDDLISSFFLLTAISLLKLEVTNVMSG
eukprot:gene4843-9647_t